MLAVAHPPEDPPAPSPEGRAFGVPGDEHDDDESQDLARARAPPNPSASTGEARRRARAFRRADAARVPRTRRAGGVRSALPRHRHSLGGDSSEAGTVPRVVACLQRPDGPPPAQRIKPSDESRGVRSSARRVGVLRGRTPLDCAARSPRSACDSTARPHSPRTRADQVEPVALPPLAARERGGGPWVT